MNPFYLGNRKKGACGGEKIGLVVNVLGVDGFGIGGLYGDSDGMSSPGNLNPNWQWCKLWGP